MSGEKIHPGPNRNTVLTNIDETLSDDGKTAPTPRVKAAASAKGKAGAKGAKGKPTTAAGASSAAASGSGSKARLESTGSEAGSAEYKCLIRATLKREGHQKEKISLIVSVLL